MDQIMNKMGSYWIGKRASKELDSVGDDINSLGSSIEGGTKWLVNKIKGIFPRDATNYEFNEETKKLTVFIPSICEVGYRDKSILRFSTTVTGYLEKGKLVDIEGIKTKFMLWLKVTTIASEGVKLHFAVGMRKTRDRAAYEVLRDGITVDKF
ncbi:hypothetical protein KPL71_018203 [Citrus sinensis]|uniref:Uncharacterized protein n=1 Tax=Citrus sinensis TaxID=2711 RepID=A0ACB8JY93_CITSI|nr:hypothetical protein KPL71_018203 [Citrus sinensis]